MQEPRHFKQRVALSWKPLEGALIGRHGWVGWGLRLSSGRLEQKDVGDLFLSMEEELANFQLLLSGGHCDYTL